MKAIVYESNTGSTKKYAEMLGAKSGLPVYERKEAAKHLGEKDEIIYMGWLMASRIKGYEKAAKHFTVKAVCGVGMTAPGEVSIKELTESNHITDAKVFYFRGGYDINKLRGMYKLMMKTMTKVLLKKLEEKQDKTDGDLESIDMLINGKWCVKEENLAPVLAWLSA